MSLQNDPTVETFVETLKDGTKRTTFRKVLQNMKSKVRKGGRQSKGKHKGKEPVNWRDAPFWKERLGQTQESKGASVGGYQRSWDDYEYGDPYSSVGRTAGPGKSTGYKYDSKSSYIDVVNADGKVIATKETWSQTWMDAALKVYPSTDPNRVTVPEANVKKLIEGAVTFNACTFTATEDYLQSLFGRLLHRSDKEWLALHPFATDDGIAVEYMASAVHELVSVYGFGVSRIRLRAGMLAAGVDHKKWARALGCNPFGLVDHRMSNADAAGRLGMPVEQADILFRFEYHEDPFPGSVVGERGWSSATAGTGVGAGGGHARYMAPRDHVGDWQISLLLQPLSDLSYAQEVVPTPYERRRGALSFNVDDVMRPDGTPVHTWGSATTKDNAQGAFFPAAGALVKARHKEVGYCVRCKADDVDTDDMLDPQVMALCTMCIEELWDGYVCPGCNADLVDAPPFLSDETTMEFTCTRCAGGMMPPSDTAILCFREAVEGIVGKA